MVTRSGDILPEQTFFLRSTSSRLGSCLLALGLTLALAGCGQTPQATTSQVATAPSATLRPLALTPFANTTAIGIPTFGPASLYPSTINVSGVTGTVTKVTVTISNFSHTWLHDVSMLLVGPTGQTVMLAGRPGDGTDVNNMSLTFDDAAAGFLPHLDSFSSGTYKPTNHHWGENLFAPAPRSPYGSTLGTFNSLNPNGTWKLYVADLVGGFAGSVAGGWSLSLTTSDMVPPTITINTPADSAQYLLGQAVSADYRCADETALASCAGSVANGAAIDTGTVGPHEFTVNARDEEGNPASLTHTYSVVYPYSGFFQPVDNPGSGVTPIFNQTRAGSAVPVKFSLGGDRGLNLFPAGSPASRLVGCDGSATVDPIEETVTAGGSSLKYDAATGTYSYIWKTDKSWARTCLVLMVTLNDGTAEAV